MCVLAEDNGVNWKGDGKADIGGTSKISVFNQEASNSNLQNLYKTDFAEKRENYQGIKAPMGDDTGAVFRLILVLGHVFTTFPCFIYKNIYRC